LRRLELAMVASGDFSSYRFFKTRRPIRKKAGRKGPRGHLGQSFLPTWMIARKRAETRGPRRRTLADTGGMMAKRLNGCLRFCPPRAPELPSRALTGRLLRTMARRNSANGKASTTVYTSLTLRKKGGIRSAARCPVPGGPSRVGSGPVFDPAKRGDCLPAAQPAPKQFRIYRGRNVRAAASGGAGIWPCSRFVFYVRAFSLLLAVSDCFSRRVFFFFFFFFCIFLARMPGFFAWRGTIAGDDGGLFMADQLLP